MGVIRFSRAGIDETKLFRADPDKLLSIASGWICQCIYGNYLCDSIDILNYKQNLQPVH